MRLFKWNKLYSAFVPEIDEEHRKLFGLGEELYHDLVEGARASKLKPKARELAAAIEEHFSSEERMMEATRYPTMGWHKQQHDAVRKRVREIGAAIEKGDREAQVLLLQYLSGWMKHHASLTDRMLGAYLRNRERLRSV